MSLNKQVIIQLVPHSRRGPAKCAGCSANLVPNSYRIKPTKSHRYFHPACYENKVDVVKMLREQSETWDLIVDLARMDVETTALVMQWAETAADPINGATDVGEKILNNWPKTDEASTICSVSVMIGPVDDAVVEDGDAPVYPAKLSEVLGAMQNKRRTLKDVAARQAMNGY